MSAIDKLRGVFQSEGLAGLMFRVRHRLSLTQLPPLRRRAERRIDILYRQFTGNLIWAQAFAEKYIPRDHREKRGFILDFGCGRGRFSSLLAMLGYEMVSIEPFLPDDRIRKDRIRYVRADESLLDGIPENSFQGCVCFQVIEYVPDDERVVRNMRRIIEPGGFFTLQTPNRDNIVMRLRKRRLAYLPQFPNVRYYTKEDLTQLMERNGFAVEKIFYEKFYSPVFTHFVNYLYEFVFPESWKEWLDNITPPRMRGLITVIARKKD